MHSFNFFISALFGLAVARSDQCISPHIEGNLKCNTCDEAGDQLRGSQCVVQDRWFSCYASIEQCCSNTEVAEVQSKQACIDAYKDSKSGTHYNGDSTVPDDIYCDQVASLSSDITNEECQRQCRTLIEQKAKPSDNRRFSGNCKRMHYTQAKGRVVLPEGSCYDKWVYGYSEPKELSGYKVYENVSSPAICQSYCQQDEDCVRFTYASEFAQSEDAVARCSLKNKLQVEVPLSIIYTSASNPHNFDKEFCNYAMSWSCWNREYDCSPCDGPLTCVWKSDIHVNGDKFCGTQDRCASGDATTTTAAPKTTAVAPTATKSGTARTKSARVSTTAAPKTTTKSVRTTTTSTAGPTVTAGPSTNVAPKTTTTTKVVRTTTTTSAATIADPTMTGCEGSNTTTEAAMTRPVCGKCETCRDHDRAMMKVSQRSKRMLVIDN